MEGRQEYAAEVQGQTEKIPEMDTNLRHYLRKEIPKFSNIDPDTVIGKIEEMSREHIPNTRIVLFNVFQPIFESNTQLFVGRLLGYRKRMCRDNGNCRRLGCYFNHESVDENMMEIDERQDFRAREDKGGMLNALIDKQRRIIDILKKRRDLPQDLYPVFEQLKKTSLRMKTIVQKMAEMGPRSTRFVIENKQEWMTREHLLTYPGVLSISDAGVIECVTRKDAERVIRMLCKGDHTVRPTWV